jgi:hypothetical protein
MGATIKELLGPCRGYICKTETEPRRPPPIVMTSTTNLIRFQIYLKDHVKGEYEFRNTLNGTRFITKEMAKYSVMKSYLEKNNLHNFTFSLNSENPTMQ